MSMNGISKGAFAISLIAVLLTSVLLSYGVSSLVVKVGPEGIQGVKGDKGDTGATGPQGIQGDTGTTGLRGSQGEQGLQGIQGPTGPVGGVEADVTASLTSTYTDVWLGTDTHDVEGLMINFGTETAYSVSITITWHTIGGGEHTEPADSLGNLYGHEIYPYSKRYFIEGSFDYITLEITWS